ncbi:hypothetical protein R6Q59_006815 [Mikania micrantha]
MGYLAMDCWCTTKLTKSPNLLHPGVKNERTRFQNAQPTKIFMQFHAYMRIYASKSSPKKLKKPKETQKFANSQLAEISLDKQNGISDKFSPTDSIDNLDSGPSIAIASRTSVLQACTLTSGFIAFMGVIIRQGSHLVSSQGWPISDCSSEISFNFEIWHLQLIAGLVILISVSRLLLLKTWSDFAESSEASNQQVLTSLEPLDYAIVAFLPGISETSTSILTWVYVNFFRPAKNLKKYGSWALVTGSTDGIGKAFAFELAKNGLNLILVGRNPSKLEGVSSEIRSKFVETQIKEVVFDLSGDLSEGIKKITEAIEGLDVGILINNAGVSYPYARFFHEVDDELLTNLIKVNVEGTTKVTHAVLPAMVKRKKGAIVNIGSGAAIVIPSDPLYAVYAATKAYVDQFSRCLYVEYKNSGIDVQCQVPLYVATKMASIKRSSFFVPSVTGYAKAGLRWLGHEPRCTPYWPHSLIWGLLYTLPEFAIDTWRYNFCLKIRKKGQLKDSRKKE